MLKNPWERLIAAALLCGAGCASNNDLPPSAATAVTAKRKTVTIPMRDGFKLSGTLSLPSSDGRHSTVLLRTPYGRGAFFPTEYSSDYAVISEDVRGRGDSQGVWAPFLSERKDGFDTIQWIASQPWSNGKVAMVGASYMAYVQWAAAVENPPALKCILSDSTPPDPYQNIPYENGVFLLATDLWYAGLIGRSTPTGPGVAPTQNPYATRPLRDLDSAVKGSRNDVFQQWLTMEHPGDWASGSTIPEMNRCKVPALLLTGWNDGDHVGTQLRWAARPGFPDQFLICGDWGHGAPSGALIGNGQGPTLGAVERAFLENYLGEKPPASHFAPRAQVFLKGVGKWYAGEEWPPSSASHRTFFLNGDGTLADSPGTRTAGYDYDPRRINILPQLRGNPMNDMEIEPLRESDLPFGHLLFHGPSITASLHVVGAPVVSFHFKSSARDTDFFFQMFDEAPDHVYVPIGQAGKFRARYYATQHGDLLESGKEYTAKLSLWDCECLLKAGHRLTMMVSSDRFPVYATNLNTGEPLASATHAVTARQTIFPDSKFEISVMND